MLLRQRRHIERAGFTLLEIIVVVAIILILAGAGIVMYTNVLSDADVNRAKMDVKSLEQAIVIYKTKHRYWPQSLDILAERDPEDGSPAILKDRSVLLDPWKQAYIYDSNSKHPTNDMPLIYSNGPPGMNKQIRNWD